MTLRLGLIMVTASCAAAPSSASSSPPASRSAPTAAPSIAAPVAVPAPVATDAHKDDGGASAAPDAVSTDPANVVVDVPAWLLAHHATSHPDSQVEMEIGSAACHAVTVGPDETDALACASQMPIANLSVSKGGETVFPFVLVAVDASKGTVRTLLHAPLEAGSLAEPLVYVQLAAMVASDGMSVTIAETSEPNGNCAAATKKWRESWSDGAERQIQRDFLQTIASACRARGTYVWQRGRFVPKP